jgi:5-(carboxyamino)imidazole ribonucleotide mutase
LPVIGVPIKSTNSADGWDSILSILQMPGGVPVATVALNGAKNAGLLAAQIIGTHNEKIALAMDDYKSKMESEVLEKVNQLKTNWENQFDA